MSSFVAAASDLVASRSSGTDGQEPVCGARQAGDDHAEGYTSGAAYTRAVGWIGIGTPLSGDIDYMEPVDQTTYKGRLLRRRVMTRDDIT